MKESGIRLEPFDMKYSGEYYKEFNEDITRYQWPDPYAQSKFCAPFQKHRRCRSPDPGIS